MMPAAVEGEMPEARLSRLALPELPLE